MKRVIVKNVSKKFEIGFKKQQSALARFVSFFSGRESKKEFWVLKNISFDAEQKENIGIVGKNGSGKSTLLRTIAGIYNLDKGRIKTKGKLVYLGGFGTGLKPRLTMRENIYLCGSILGLNNKEIKKRFSEIVRFSGLKEYVDTKVYQFSDGMMLRLAFSITIHCVAHSKPDIILLDEVFGGGGDKDFRQTSLTKIEKLINGGATVLLVSHDLELIKKYCDRVLWIDSGKIIKQGGAEEVVDSYLKNGE